MFSSLRSPPRAAATLATRRRVGPPCAGSSRLSASSSLSAASSTTPILAIAVPFSLDDGVPASPPSYLASGSSSQPPIVLSTTFSQSSQPAIDALAWALAQGFTVNIDVQSDLQQDSGWELFEDFLTKATAAPEAKGKIVLCEWLIKFSLLFSSPSFVQHVHSSGTSELSVIMW